MSDGPTGWLPLILTTFGAGVAGSVIATYGGQAQQRRKARSEALSALQKFDFGRQEAERLGLDPDAGEHQLAQLQATFILAGVPLKIVDVYLLAARSVNYRVTLGKTEVQRLMDKTGRNLGDTLINDALNLIRQTMWHPWFSLALGRTIRAPIIQRRIQRVFPGLRWKANSTKAALSSYDSATRAYRIELGARLRPTRDERRTARLERYMAKYLRANDDERS
jgi:hypothetical protein